MLHEKPSEKTINFLVNGELEQTNNQKLTVRAILEKAGLTPPEEYKLVRDNGSKEFTNLDEEIPIHEGEKFTALFKGPTPTS